MEIRKTVWHREELYWQWLLAGDMDAYMTLWHEDAAAWAAGADGPASKFGVRQHMQGLLDGIDLKSAQFDLKARSIQEFGDQLAVVQYEVNGKVRLKSGEQQSFKHRITHTWLLVGGEWLIIGGMSAEMAA